MTKIKTQCVEALRQYQHNDGSGLLAGYDKEIIDREILAMREEITRLKDKNGKLETVADYLADVMENDGVENFTANYFNRDGRGFELICRYAEGKSVADVMTEQQEEITRLQAEVERLKEAVAVNKLPQNLKEMVGASFIKNMTEKEVHDCFESLKDRAEKAEQRAEQLQRERDGYHAMVVYAGSIMDESTGVAGWHLNGDVADWDELFTTDAHKSAIEKFKNEQQIKALEDLLNRTCPVSGPVIQDESDKQSIRDEIQQLRKGGEQL